MDNKIIFALDVYNYDTAIELAKNVGDKVFAIKVNWPVILENGIKIVRDLSKYSSVICDFKLADIDNTVSLITEKVREHGAYGIISHSFTGLNSLKAVVKSAKEMKVFSVVSMSQESYLDNITEELINTSKEAGVYGLVAPGNRPYYLKKVKELSGDLKIISPGVGAQGGNITEAILLGADYVIIGRSIYNSPDPEKTIDNYADSINNKLNK
ncbi:orotidine-5'-phosphate decarboxylase [Ferroplasma sp.]|uniref:orotidine-5'-phosphate decarboxylase n=1 Tax=Ferroplasma sp. TaxID=2591003 RepID=UPI00307DABA2